MYTKSILIAAVLALFFAIDAGFYALGFLIPYLINFDAFMAYLIGYFIAFLVLFALFVLVGPWLMKGASHNDKGWFGLLGTVLWFGTFPLALRMHNNGPLLDGQLTFYMWFIGTGVLLFVTFCFFVKSLRQPFYSR